MVRASLSLVVIILRAFSMPPGCQTGFPKNRIIELHDAVRDGLLSAANVARLFYVNTEGTETIGVRGHAPTKEQQLKCVAVC